MRSGELWLTYKAVHLIMEQPPWLRLMIKHDVFWSVDLVHNESGGHQVMKGEYLGCKLATS
jgi:hypothetical protein